YNNIRIPVTWMDRFDGNNLADDNGNVNFNHSRFIQLVEVIDYALTKGMYVIINTHHEAWLKEDYNGSTSDNAIFGNLWTYIAEYFQGYSYKLVFEVLNEPEGSMGDWSTPGPLPTDSTALSLTREINQVGYDAIRATGGGNTDRVILVAPNGQGNQSQLDDVYPNVASIPGAGADEYLGFTVHTYDPWDFCGQTGSNSFYSSTSVMVSEVSGTINDVADYSESLGVALHYGEFGVGRDGNQAERNTDLVREYYRTVAQTALDRAIPVSVWDDRGWFGMVEGNGSGGFQFLYNIATYMIEQQ
nr:cellulase family glycosylhydrolase [Spirochaetaceae bacterium]